MGFGEVEGCAVQQELGQVLHRIIQERRGWLKIEHLVALEEDDSGSLQLLDTQP